MNVTLTAANLAKAISLLNRDVVYDYPNPKTTTKIKVVNVKLPEGPIKFLRYDPSKGETFENAVEKTISTEMLWRMAGAIKPNHPVNVDRVFGASYNSRSVLEALLLHTPEFYLCYPGRLERIGNQSKIKKGHKHMIYRPHEPHQTGVWQLYNVENMVISEVARELHYDALSYDLNKERELGIDIARRHAQIQMLLIESASAMGLKSWIDKNDQAIEYKGKKFIEHDAVLQDLSTVVSLSAYPEACDAAKHIDCIWFADEGKKIPAIMEIEHTTGITSGLNRMQRFKEEAPDFAHMTYIIVADDEDRSEVVKKANFPQFKDLNVKYLPYSAVEDLYLLAVRGIQGIDNTKFIHTFLETV